MKASELRLQRQDVVAKATQRLHRDRVIELRESVAAA